MLKVIGVIAFLIMLYFVIQGFVDVVSAPDLFERSENDSGSENNEVEHE